MFRSLGIAWDCLARILEQFTQVSTGTGEVLVEGVEITKDEVRSLHTRMDKAIKKKLQSSCTTGADGRNNNNNFMINSRIFFENH